MYIPDEFKQFFPSLFKHWRNESPETNSVSPPFPECTYNIILLNSHYLKKIKTNLRKSFRVRSSREVLWERFEMNCARVYRIRASNSNPTLRIFVVSILCLWFWSNKMNQLEKKFHQYSFNDSQYWSQSTFTQTASVIFASQQILIDGKPVTSLLFISHWICILTFRWFWKFSHVYTETKSCKSPCFTGISLIFFDSINSTTHRNSKQYSQFILNIHYQYSRCFRNFRLSNSRNTRNNKHTVWYQLSLLRERIYLSIYW